MEEEQQEELETLNMVISLDNIPECTYLEGDTYYTNFIVTKGLLPDVLVGETLEINGKSWEIMETTGNNYFIIFKCKGE